MADDPRLTDRQLAVLRLTAEGYSAKEVAAELSLSVTTVNKHVEQARLKMRATNRAHLITLAFNAGLISRQH